MTFMAHGIYTRGRQGSERFCLMMFQRLFPYRPLLYEHMTIIYGLLFDMQPRAPSFLATGDANASLLPSERAYASLVSPERACFELSDHKFKPESESSAYKQG